MFGKRSLGGSSSLRAKTYQLLLTTEWRLFDFFVSRMLIAMRAELFQF
jgi:hypothetical protein